MSIQPHSFDLSAMQVLVKDWLGPITREFDLPGSDIAASDRKCCREHPKLTEVTATKYFG
jgi:hypothetical protein